MAKKIWLIYFALNVLGIVTSFVYDAEWLRATVGISLGLLIGFALFALATPLFINSLVNNPKGKKGEEDPPIVPGRIHFFTYMGPGIAKNKVRMKKFAGAIMDDPRRVFAKIGDPKQTPDTYWAVREAKPGEVSEPLPPLNVLDPINCWAHWVYHWTGAVFAGIWPFQGIRISKNQRWKQKKENGKVALDEKGLPVLELVEDWSDHYRTKPDDVVFLIPALDTADFQKIGFRGYMRYQCDNPYQAAFNNQRWDLVFASQRDTAAVAFCKTKTFAELATADQTTMYEFGDFLKSSLNAFLERQNVGLGVEILDVGITDQNPHLSPEDQKSLTQKWRATQEKDAKMTIAEGEKQATIKAAEAKKQAGLLEADVKARDFEVETEGLEKRMTAIRKDPEIGMRLAELDAQEDTVKGSKNATVVVQQSGGGGNFDATTYSKLQELIDAIEGLHLTPPKEEKKPSEETPRDNKPDKRSKKR